jgi:murein L,D-transpeptidase YafK
VINHISLRFTAQIPGKSLKLNKFFPFQAVLLFCWSQVAYADCLRNIDKVLVKKAERKLDLLFKGSSGSEEICKTYKVALGPNPLGHKERQGDGRTPEGLYRLDWRNPKSKFHLALHISYPNEADRAHAQKLGVSPGGDIMLHGLPNNLGWLGSSHTLHDWTDGCIAVTSEEIEEIWKAVKDGTPIEIKP